MVLQGCRTLSEDGTRFTLYGNLNVNADVELDERGRVLSLDGSHEGTLGWQSGDRSGSCPMTLSTSGSSTEEGNSLSLTGTLCGNTVSYTLSR